MTIFQSIFLGIIQGLTEFIPVSSSGHLVIMPYLFGWNIQAEDAFIFDVLVQVATLTGVFAYFWKDIIRIVYAVGSGILNKRPWQDPQARLGWYLVLATIPAGALGLIIKPAVERAFNSPVAAALFLLLTALLLITAERLGYPQKTLVDLNWKDALWIGFSQVLALFPGVSRSGATITGGMLRGYNRAPAARFSFLMSIPVMLAAGTAAVIDLIQVPHFLDLLPAYLPGFLSAALTGYLSIRWLLNYLTHHRLLVFAVYCFFLSLVTIGTSVLRII